MIDPFTLMALEKIKKAVDQQTLWRGTLASNTVAVTFFGNQPAIEQVCLTWDELRRLSELLERLI